MYFCFTEKKDSRSCSFMWEVTSRENVLVALKRAGWMKCVSYLELVYFVTAFVPSETACLASSRGRSQAAVCISCFSGQDSCLQQQSSQIVIDKSSWCSWLGRKHLYQDALASIPSRCRWRRTPSSWISSIIVSCYHGFAGSYFGILGLHSVVSAGSVDLTATQQTP